MKFILVPFEYDSGKLVYTLYKFSINALNKRQKDYDYDMFTLSPPDPGVSDDQGPSMQTPAFMRTDGLAQGLMYLRREFVNNEDLRHVIVMKGSKSITGADQENDVGNSHKGHQNFIKGEKYNYEWEQPTDDTGSESYKRVKARIARFASSMTQQAKLHVLKFVHYLPQLVLRAWTTQGIKRSFFLCGTSPLNARQNMSMCTSWSQVTREMQDQIIEAIESLADKPFDDHGAILDCDLIEAGLGWVIGRENGGTNPDDRAESRRRALVYSFADYNKRVRREAELREAKKQAELAAKEAEKQRKKDNKAEEKVEKKKAMEKKVQALVNKEVKKQAREAKAAKVVKCTTCGTPKPTQRGTRGWVRCTKGCVDTWWCMDHHAERDAHKNNYNHE